MNAPADPKMVAAVKEADEKKAALDALPSAEELFPGMIDVRRSFYMGQLAIAAVGFFEDGRYWWDQQMLPRERAFLCRVARVDVKLSEKDWRDVPMPERARLICRFVWIHDWVNSFHPPLQLFRPVAIDA